MSKRIEIEGKFYRERRGKMVEIPIEWVGKIVTKQRKRHRLSKQHSVGARHLVQAQLNCKNPHYIAHRYDSIYE